MSAITLESIKAELSKIGEKIAKFEAQVPRLFVVPETDIELKAGEHYAGILLGKDGKPHQHIILLPDEAESINWADAKAWATKAGGELPTRREQALLYANLKEEFQEAWYWSCEQHASSSDYAWHQNFDYGSQSYYLTGLKLRARAVRRLEIQ